MKTLLLTLAILLSISVKGQVNPIFPWVNVWRVYPQNACIGDTLYVDFKFTPPQQGTVQTANWQLKTSSSSTVAWTGNWNTFYYLPKETFYPLAWNDSCYIMKLKVTGINGLGTATVTSTGDPGMFTLQNCSVGIYEYKESPTINALYYDLQGNRIEKKPNELIIEQVGLNRKKVFITD